MANEKRLIDADAFIEDIKTEIMNLYLDGMKGTPRPRSELYDIIDRIGEQPTVDAVEVVRCKNCRDCEMCYPEKRLDKEATQAWICNRYKRYCKPDDFCSYGERRTDDG